MYLIHEERRLCQQVRNPSMKKLLSITFASSIILFSSCNESKKNKNNDNDESIQRSFSLVNSVDYNGFIENSKQLIKLVDQANSLVASETSEAENKLLELENNVLSIDLYDFIWNYDQEKCKNSSKIITKLADAISNSSNTLSTILTEGNDDHYEIIPLESENMAIAYTINDKENIMSGEIWGRSDEENTTLMVLEQTWNNEKTKTNISNKVEILGNLKEGTITYRFRTKGKANAEADNHDIVELLNIGGKSLTEWNFISTFAAPNSENKVTNNNINLKINITDENEFRIEGYASSQLEGKTSSKSLKKTFIKGNSTNCDAKN